MDEADLLGDRVSIISGGSLQCSGTPLFLKRYFGKGYFLTVVSNPSESDVFEQHRLTNFIASYVPGSKLRECFGHELAYTLPPSERATGGFTELFQQLEAQSINLGIESYGISDTTLEEVSVY